MKVLAVLLTAVAVAPGQLPGARSIKVCALLHKPERSVVKVPIEYLGFTIPNEFVVGYGLDYAQRYRNLPFIGVLEDEPLRS